MATTVMFSLLAFLIATAVQQQPPRAPNVNAQRQAMKKLGLLSLAIVLITEGSARGSV